MLHHLKHAFIPHEGNNYHPHILHPKRIAFYGISLMCMKLVVFLFALLLPVQVFMLPDVLELQRQEIVALTNAQRAAHGRGQLAVHPALDRSAQWKSDDMGAHSYFSHTGPDGSNLRTFLAQANYQYSVAGENLAMGFTSAADVMGAWEKSATHFANILDIEFSEIGVGLAAGKYRGTPTVFIAQHFGAPAPPARIAGQAVTQAPLSAPTELPHGYDERRSTVRWEAVDKNTTALFITAYISKETAADPVVKVNGFETTLSQDPNDPERFVGQMTIPQSHEALFRVITIPNIAIQAADGTMQAYPIHWDRIEVVSPTPMEKYTQTKVFLGDLTSIFSVSRGIFAFFLGLFGLALVLNIFVEMKKQHPHVIVQSMALVLLIAVFLIV